MRINRLYSVFPTKIHAQGYLRPKVPSLSLLTQSKHSVTIIQKT